MIRSAASKVMWVGRATVFLVGLAVILALVFGVATTALAGTGVGAAFNLGKVNSVDRISKLVGSTASSMLMVDNNGTGPALDLKVGNPTTPAADKTTPPMKVDSQAEVANLNAARAGRADSAVSADNATNAQNAANAGNADKLDNLDSAAFQKRVGEECAVGSSIRTIDANGVVTCEQDDSGASGAAGGDLTGNYPNPQLANGAVRGGPGGEIEDESITSHDINEHGVTSMDILNDTIESGDISTGGVGSAEVANGSLDVADVTEFQYNFTVDLPPISGQSCYTGSETLSTVDGGDLVIVNAADDLPSGLVMFPLTPSSSNPQFKFRMCNITSSTIDLASGGAWRLAVFDDGNDI